MKPGADRQPNHRWLFSTILGMRFESLQSHKKVTVHLYSDLFLFQPFIPFGISIQANKCQISSFTRNTEIGDS